MAKKKISLDEALKKEDVHTYEEAQARADEHKLLIANKEISNNVKGAGRKKIGKTIVTHQISFRVDDEQLEFLEKLVNRKEKLNTPNAVTKKIFLEYFKNYNLQSEK